MASYQLIVNSGSASKKYALAKDGAVIALGHLEHMPRGFMFTISVLGKERQQDIAPDRRAFAPLIFIETCIRQGLISSIEEVQAIVFRIVAPGTHFQSHRELSPGTLERLKALEVLSPAHIRATLEDIEDVSKQFPGRRLLSASDSAFHSTIPSIAREYALDPEFAATYDIYRNGYHGLSTASIVSKLRNRGAVPERLIVIHVGGGISVTAVEKGISIETSMGFLPLTGVPMATRAGDLDAGALLALLERSSDEPERLIRRLYHESGLVNYANLGHGGIKELLVASKVGNHEATHALAKYSYHLRKEIASAVAVLSGVDAVLLTGTALLRSPRLRMLTISGLGHISLVIDPRRNEECGSGEGVLSGESGTLIEVVRTHEMDEMARIGHEL
ncbi:MAG: hypothetical protein Q8P93_03795 [bacterium]|nr:hypothetical protein [bacterium]